MSILVKKCKIFATTTSKIKSPSLVISPEFWAYYYATPSLCSDIWVQ